MQLGGLGSSPSGVWAELDPEPNFSKITDGWKKNSADIRLSRIIAISKKYDWNSADCRYFFLKYGWSLAHTCNAEELSVTNSHSQLKLIILSCTKQTRCKRSAEMLEHCLAVRHQHSSWKHRFNLHRGRELRIFGRFYVKKTWRVGSISQIFGGRKFGGEYG